MKVIIDRFEGNFALCEKKDRTMMDIERNKIPETAKEGDVLILSGNTIVIDIEETEIRKKQIQEQTKDLWN